MSSESNESQLDHSSPELPSGEESKVTKAAAHEKQASDCLSPGDYVAPGLALIKPDQCFPHMKAGDPTLNPWAFLRREIPHNWYVDDRYPQMGFLSRDEAHILYNTALKFKGKAALEIGCWMGWSACHLALGGVTLDIVDPVLEKPEFYSSVSQSLQRAGVIDSVRLIPGYSPEKVQELVDQQSSKWSLIFIDGNHEAPYPFKDAELCEQFAEADAAILFHDPASPDVAAGLEYLRQKGWNTMIYQTMQIMGIAWRGNVEPVIHQPDPNVSWYLPQHLSIYRSQFSEEAQTAEKTLAPFGEELDRLRLLLNTSQAEGWRLRGSEEWSRKHLEKTMSELSQAQDNLIYHQNELANTQTQLMQSKSELSQAQDNLIYHQNELANTQTQLMQSKRVLAYSQAQVSQSETEVQMLQSQLSQSQKEVKQLRPQLHQAEETTQQALTESSEIRSLLINTRTEFQTLREQLQESKEQINAMETSKFWKLRKGWFKIKRLFGLKEDG